MRYQQIAVYMLASGRAGTLYIGVTSYLTKRIYEHREKRLKKYTRAAKIKLIEAMNPSWDDLWDSISAQ